MNEWGRLRKPFFFMTGFDGLEWVVTEPERLEDESVRLSMPGFSTGKKKRAGGPFRFDREPVTRERYSKAFSRVMRAITRGDTFLLNLTFPTRLFTGLSLDEIFDRAEAPFLLKYKDEFICFSPEPFVRITGTTISSFPMKGTIDASAEDAEQRLLSNPKELGEHYTIVDLIRNDLNRVAKRVKVERFRYVERVRTNRRELLQTSSHISGETGENWPERVGDILAELLPAGSVTGAPKPKTVEIIREAEGYERGWFTGVFGIFDGASLQSAVMIRFIEKQKDGLVFKSGGGITCFSKEKEEYEEMVNKVYLPFS
ncbi:MAG: aminodeoxychorismate synthase component I [Bacteroidales bacterium]